MGFCIFNNIAIAGLYARKKHGAERVAVVDFDVHHGNGTQDIFWSDKDLYLGSTHQMPLYPGTGALSETGVGNIWNAPLRPGDAGDRFKEAFESRILPALRNLGPSRPGPFWLYRSAADHIASLVRPDDRILDLTDWSLFFSGRSGYHFAYVFSAPADRATRWIVVTAPHVDGDRSFSPIVRRLIGDKEPLICIPPLADKKQLQLRIYDRGSRPTVTRVADVNK